MIHLSNLHKLELEI